MRASRKTALVVAGSDPTGGAGAQADLLTFAAHGIQARAVLTAATVQDEHGVKRVGPLPGDHVSEQLASSLSIGAPDVIKVGMLTRLATVESLVSALDDLPNVPVVLDPVLHATAGGELLEPRGIQCVRETLIPRATVTTPNATELARLLGRQSLGDDDVEPAARSLAKESGRAILVTGGHHGAPHESTDVLARPDGNVQYISHPRLSTGVIHGTGCALSSSIAARLALGETLDDAIRLAADHVWRLIEKAHEQEQWILPLLHPALEA